MKGEKTWLILASRESTSWPEQNYIPLFFFFKLINYFIYVCVGSSFLCKGLLQLWQVGATLHRGVRASHCRSLSHRGAQAPDAQAQ